MSLKAIVWAWDQKTARSTEKLVLLCLANCHNGETGLCFPSREYIASQTGLNIKTITAGIANLEHQGVIAVIRRPGSNTYKLVGKNGEDPETGAKCAYCGIEPIEHLDHVYPQSRGGSEGPTVGSCSKCNRHKGALNPAEWAMTQRKVPAKLAGIYHRLGFEGTNEWYAGGSKKRDPKTVHQKRDIEDPKTDGARPNFGKSATQNWDTNQEVTRKEPLVSRAEPKSDASEQEKRAERGPHKLPADWYPSEDLINRCASMGLTVQNPEQVIQEFRDYWIHNGKRKKDWSRTFINRMKQQHQWEQAKGQRHGKSNSTDLLADDLNRALNSDATPGW